jgi:large subunit ribosomal protein L9
MYYLVVILACISHVTIAQAKSYASSAFIQSASPNIILGSNFHSSTSSAQNGNRANTKTIYSKKVPGVNPTFGRNGIPLMAKKKKDTTVGKGSKVQVKLLKHVAGTGQAGEIIMVAPAFFTNKLQKTGSAKRISDEEVQKEMAEKDSLTKEQKANAMVVKKKLEEMKMSFSKKAGDEGHLFGSVGFKVILAELKKEFPQGCLDGKQVKITEIKNSDGKKVRGGDIKEVGEYSVSVSLLKDVSAKLELSVGKK